MTVLYDQIATNAQNTPDKIAFIEGDFCLTYAQLMQHVACWVAAFQSQQNQLCKPLRVLSVCEKLSNNLLIVLALAKINGTLIPANSQFTGEQLAEFADAVDANLILCDQQTKLDEIKNSQITANIQSVEAFFSEERNVKHTSNSFAVEENDSFLIALSSGSTGKPKPIVISQACKLARAEQSIALYSLNPISVVLNASPFFHSLGQRLCFVPLVAGGTLVVLPNFTPKKWIDLVEKHQVTFTIPVATHLYALQPILRESFARLKSLHTLVTSSAPIDTDFKQQFAKKIQCQLHEIYGATEVAIATNLAPTDFMHKVHTVGKACDGVEIQIIDENCQILPNGETGEVAVRSALMFSDYYQLPDLTQDAMVNGYFRTGDLGYLDDDGFLVYVSRQKDVIISGGINIYPAVIENALLQVDDLQTVCVIGVNDALFGEVVIAICVGDDSLEGMLRQQANKKLASYQRPMRYFFVEALPLTPSGKIDKMSLRAHYNGLGEDWTAILRAMLYR